MYDQQTPSLHPAQSSLPTQRRKPRRRAKLRGALLAAAALGGAALFNRARAQRAERDNPPAGRFIEVDGVRLHFVERGQGPSVVLLHGNGVMIQDMEVSSLLERVAEQYRVIAFDRPGFGFSERPRSTVWTPVAQAKLIYKALRQLGVERPIVVGHSWGTLVTLALALDHPDAVGAIVLLSGYYFPTARADMPLMSGPAVPVVGDVMRYTLSPLLGRLMAPAIVRHTFAPDPVPGRFAEFPIDLALRPSQIRASAADTALMVPGAAELSRRYAELSLPVVIVAGDEDKIADFGRQSARLHTELPGSELRVVRGAGHMIHHTAPDEVLAAISLASQRLAEQPARGDAVRLVELEAQPA